MAEENAFGWSDPEDEHAVLDNLLVPMARERLDGRLRDCDALDTKALGTLALDGAALAVLVAAHESINRLWWIPAIALGTAAAMLLIAIWPRRFDFGPDLRSFYSDLSDSSPLTASRQMFAEVLAALDANNDQMAVKIWFFWIGLSVFVLGLVGCIPIALVRPG
jgi:hypothetical protein